MRKEGVVRTYGKQKRFSMCVTLSEGLQFGPERSHESALSFLCTNSPARTPP